MQQQQTAGKPGVVRQSAWTRFVKDHGSILMFLILFVLASVFVKNFFAVRNIFTVIKQAAVPLVACMGLMLILTTGGIDLSLGYTLGLCSVLLGMMTKRYGFPAWQAIPLTLLIGAAVGLFNGALVQFLRVPAFIATLGSGYVRRLLSAAGGSAGLRRHAAVGGHSRIAARRRAGQYIHLPTGKTADVRVHLRHRRGAGLLFAP